MKFDFREQGDIRQAMREHELAAERGVTRGIRAAGRGLKKDWRGQVVSSGLGRRLANTIRGANYPAQGESIGAASLVYARPNANRQSASAAEVIDSHNRGALIRSDTGFYLAIPIDEVARMRGGGTSRGRKRITPDRWEQITGRALRFVYRRGQPSLLVDDGTRLQRKRSDHVGFKGSQRKSRARKTTPVFILLPQVKLRKKLDLDRDRRRWEAQLPQLIVSNWPKVKL